LRLCGQTIAIFLLVYTFAYGLSWMMRVRRQSWALEHSRLGVRAFVIGQTALLLLLAVMALLQSEPSVSVSALVVVRMAWWALVAMLILFGSIYPHLRLSSCAEAVAKSRERARRNAEENIRLQADVSLGSQGATSACKAPSNGLESSPGVLRAARGARRIAYLAFLRRYFGVLLGLFLCTVSLWAIAYRVATGLYPWQLEVLVTGLGTEEAELVQRVVAFLVGSAV